MSKEAMKLALEALEAERDNYQDWDGKDGAPEYIYEAITALREALAEQPAQQEPVACAQIVSLNDMQGVVDWLPHNGAHLKAGDYLYTPTPAQRKPLTDEQIILIVAECASSHQHTDIHFARAIEAAIWEKQK